MPPSDKLHAALQDAQIHLVDLEAHLRRASDTGDLAEVGRAWARATQVEHALRSVLPPDAIDTSLESDVKTGRKDAT